MKTTLNKIKNCDPCEEGWEKLLKALNKTQADDEEIELSFILESNGYNDALWALQAVEGYEREIRLFAIWCARQVQHLMTDQRSVNALDVAERFANGKATREELNAARAAARAALAAARAARDAARAARDAARAAEAAAEADAWAAEAAAWAAKDAARAAEAEDASRDAEAEDASRDAEDAAWDAQIIEFKKLIA